MLIFSALSPQLFLLLLARADHPQDGAVFDVSFPLITLFVAYIGWTLLIAWLCLRFLDRLKLASLGFAFHRGWWRDVLTGCLIGASMIAVVAGLQFAGGGTRVTPNPFWWRGGAIDYSGLQTVAHETLGALLLLILAGAFEELIYRGYPFQTLLRSVPTFVPILLFALLFGISHWENPNSTFLSTANTALAGIWLSLAYLKTRSLWLPTSLHFSWNWMMGAFFGLPVSGLTVPQHPIFVSTSENPVWLTGGSYGCEGGIAVTVVIVIATIFIWRAKWLSVSPEMRAALSGQTSEKQITTIDL